MTESKMVDPVPGPPEQKNWWQRQKEKMRNNPVVGGAIAGGTLGGVAGLGLGGVGAIPGAIVGAAGGAITGYMTKDKE